MTTRAPSLGRGCRAQRGEVSFLFCGEAASSLHSPSGKALCREKRYPRIVAFPIGEGGTASAVDRVLSYIACLRRSPSLSFIPLEPYPARSARHLPHAGKALSVDIVFPHISCIRSDNARKAVSSYRSLPHWGRGTAPAVDRVLSFILDLRRISPLIFHTASTPIRLAPLATFPTRGRLCVGNTASPIQPPPLQGTSSHRKEGVSTRAPSLGRGCRAQRGGVGFLLGRRSRLLFAFPIGEGGPRQRWIECSRISST